MLVYCFEYVTLTCATQLVKLVTTVVVYCFEYTTLKSVCHFVVTKFLSTYAFAVAHDVPMYDCVETAALSIFSVAKLAVVGRAVR